MPKIKTATNPKAKSTGHEGGAHVSGWCLSMGFSRWTIAVRLRGDDKLGAVQPRAKILVAEDDELTLELLATVLRGEGYEVVTVPDGRAAIDRLGEASFDLVVSDIQMTKASGLEILEAVTAQSPDTAVVLVTAYAEPGAAMDAIAKGAADYLAKPVDIVALRSTVARALSRRRLSMENRSLRNAIVERKTLVGTSPLMLELYKQIAQVAPTNATVLVTGESGSGKELVAQTIHQRSRRAAKPFIAFNCAAFAEGVLESELFGHERGAFTGAGPARQGLFEAAEGGTIFLDEVGDVPPKMQAELLRVLQEGELRRVGGSGVITVDVRVISATNRDLARQVAEGRMREDLLYRLNVVPLRVPPLRERGDDLVALTRHLVARHAALLGRPEPFISDEALAAIRAYSWPGNVRELENALARAVAMSQRGVILLGDLPALSESQKAGVAPTIDSDWPSLEELQRRYIDKVFEHTGHNKTSTAGILHVDRRTIQRLLAREAKDDDA
jgi:two-component system, NtrC family, response regulator AtoC